MVSDVLAMIINIRSAELSVKSVSMVAEADVLHCVIEKSFVWQHAISLPLHQKIVTVYKVHLMTQLNIR